MSTRNTLLVTCTVGFAFCAGFVFSENKGHQEGYRKAKLENIASDKRIRGYLQRAGVGHWCRIMTTSDEGADHD